jgi:hypothetical protein
VPAGPAPRAWRGWAPDDAFVVLGDYAAKGRTHRFRARIEDALTAASPGALDAVARLADPRVGPGPAARRPRSPTGKLPGAGACRDPWRVVGPVPTQLSTPARGRLVLAGCACRYTRTGTRRPFRAARPAQRHPLPSPSGHRPTPRPRRLRGTTPRLGTAHPLRGSAAAAQPAARRRPATLADRRAILASGPSGTRRSALPCCRLTRAATAPSTNSTPRVTLGAAVPLTDPPQELPDPLRHPAQHIKGGERPTETCAPERRRPTARFPPANRSTRKPLG